MKIEITSSDIQTISGTNARGEWSIRLQKGFLHNGEKYPTPFEFALERDQAAYAPGVYQLGKDAIRVDRKGRLDLVPRFVPAAQPQPVQKSA